MLCESNQENGNIIVQYWEREYYSTIIKNITFVMINEVDKICNRKKLIPDTK